MRPRSVLPGGEDIGRLQVTVLRMFARQIKPAECRGGIR
jgi:hypothetical protein